MSHKSIFALSVLLAAGCSSKLESGYQPRRLDMPSGRLETLYADPYSQQALTAQQDSDSQESQIRRPGTP